MTVENQIIKTLVKAKNGFYYLIPKESGMDKVNILILILKVFLLSIDTVFVSLGIQTKNVSTFLVSLSHFTKLKLTDPFSSFVLSGISDI